MRVPLGLLALPYLIGALAAILVADTAPERLLLSTAVAALLATIAGAGFFTEDEPRGVVGAILVGACAAGYASGHGYSAAAHRPTLLAWFDELPDAVEAPLVLEGRLREDAAGAPLVLSIVVTRVAAPGRSPHAVDGGVRVFVGGAPDAQRALEWTAGRAIRVPALLRVPGSFSSPGVPDDRRLQALRGTILTGSVKSAALVEVIEKGSWTDERAAAVRRFVRRTLARYVGARDARSAAVAVAILVGDRTGLSDEDERRLQDAGTYHVIAISGGNIAILTVLLLSTGRGAGIPRPAAAAGSILLLLFYGEVAGGSASVARAITAAVVFLFALVLDHRGSALNVVAVAALAAVAPWPAVLVDAGFLLSFGATLGIIIGVPRLARADAANRGGLLRRGLLLAAGVLAATLCAELVILPVTASFFSRVTAAGLLLNLVAIPLMTLVQVGGMAVLALHACYEPAAWAVAEVVHLAASGLVDSSKLVEVLPWLAGDVAPPSWGWCVAYYASVLLLVTTRWTWVWAPSVAGCAVVLVAGAGPAVRDVAPLPAGVLRITILDVGQGDAVLVSTPAGTHLLVDAAGLAGSNFDIASRVVLPSLRALRVRTLDALILTHGDPDHIGGAEVVIRRMPPAAIWEGVTVPPFAPVRQLAALAAERGIPWRTVRPGGVDRWGDVEVRVLHPPEPDWERQRVRNDDSVVLEVRYRDVSIILPGDISAGIERALIPTLAPGRVVILKAAHHGSATSSSEAFIDALRPAAVLFSAGRNNRFGHPAPVVVERFERRGIPTFNTATDGAVFVETEGRAVKVWGWKSRREFTIGGQPHH
jgi:competence protein ComEC